MGFPLGYSEIYFPKFFVHTLSFLGFVRNLIVCLFTYLGLRDFLETDNIWPETTIRIPGKPPVSAAMIGEFLPVVKFGNLAAVDLPESCAVCLYEFEAEDEIRWLKNCRHIFHRKCLDRWMDHDRNTCPLCRRSFLPDERTEGSNRPSSVAADVGDFYGDYSAVPSGWVPFL